MENPKKISEERIYPLTLFLLGQKNERLLTKVRMIILAKFNNTVE